jgi:hypothetical protein
MTAVPAPPTFVTLTTLTATQLNQIRDAVNFALNPPIAELISNAAQTITTATATAILFQAEVVDKDVSGAGGHSTSVNTSRFTAVYAGWYHCTGATGWTADATGMRAAWWAKNGTLLDRATAFITAGSANIVAVPARGMKIFLNVGDYVELMGYHTKGSNLDTTNNTPNMCSMSCHWLSN